MCRLLGFVARSPTAVRDVLGAGQFDRFTDLTRLHGDGWGMAWDGGQGIVRSIAPTAALSDPTYDRLSRRALGTVGLVHLRWATDGLAVATENTHPFVAGGMAFAHNGSIAPIPALEEMLSADRRRALRGTTDSERYFQLVRQHIDQTANVVDGVRSAVRDLVTRFPAVSMNAMLLTGDQLIVIHASSTATPPLDDLDELYPGLVDAPPDHATAYFQLRYRADDQAVVVSSTGMATPGWTDLPPSSLLVIDRRDLGIRRVELVPEEAR
jgi:predicted glutamine amidotransferase